MKSAATWQKNYERKLYATQCKRIRSTFVAEVNWSQNRLISKVYEVLKVEKFLVDCDNLKR